MDDEIYVSNSKLGLFRHCICHKRGNMFTSLTSRNPDLLVDTLDCVLLSFRHNGPRLGSEKGDMNHYQSFVI